MTVRNLFARLLTLAVAPRAAGQWPVASRSIARGGGSRAPSGDAGCPQSQRGAAAVGTGSIAPSTAGIPAVSVPRLPGTVPGGTHTQWVTARCDLPILLPCRRAVHVRLTPINNPSTTLHILLLSLAPAFTSVRPARMWLSVSVSAPCLCNALVPTVAGARCTTGHMLGCNVQNPMLSASTRTWVRLAAPSRSRDVRWGRDSGHCPFQYSLISFCLCVATEYCD